MDKNNEHVVEASVQGLLTGSEQGIREDNPYITPI